MPEVHRMADETLEGFRDGLLRRRIDQKSRDQLAEFVTGRAVDRPILPQRFVAGEDLLDQEINGAPILRERKAERLRATALQFFEILLRQIESVRMIDPHAGDGARADQLEQQPMRRIEDLRQFHPDRGEIVHVEETAVVDLLRGHAPEGEAIGLIVEQQIERIETSRLARRAVDLRHGLRDRVLHLRRFVAAPLEPALDDFFLADAFRDAFRIGLRAARQIFQRGNDALEFRVKLFVLERRQLFERDLEDVPIGAAARSGIRDRNSGGKRRPPRSAPAIRRAPGRVRIDRPGSGAGPCPEDRT